MRKTLYYIFDPLCGWCYGAHTVVADIAENPDVDLQLMPSGMFSGAGARPMGPEFSAYAWANDQRINNMTDQPFSEAYRTNVLGAEGQMFDSSMATLALAAVAMSAPQDEFKALQAIQHARYVDGLDITQPAVLAEVLAAQGLAEAAQRLQPLDPALEQANAQRVAQVQQLMEQFGVNGVPAFVLGQDGKGQLLHASDIFSQPGSLLAQVMAA